MSLANIAISLTDDLHYYNGYDIVYHLGFYDVWIEELKLNSINENFLTVDEAIAYIDDMEADSVVIYE